MPFARLLPVLCAAALAVAPGTFTSLRESYVDRGRAAVEGFIRDLARRAGNISANRADEADAHAGAGYNSSGKSYVRTLLRLLHARQHPPRHECKATRLLLVKSPEISFEGLGSVLSLLTLGLAEAVYSNRTLIWGAERELRGAG